MARSEKGVAERIDRLETEFRDGRLRKVKQELLEIHRERRVPRAKLADFASLCRRAYLSPLAVRVLHRYVRPAGRSKAEASPDEKAEYAAALNFLGANREAIEILESIDPKTSVHADLFLAFAYFRNWRWSDAVPLLERFARYAGASGRMNLAGMTYLASALMQGRWDFDRSEALLAEVVEASRKLGIRAHLRSALLLRAQHRFFLGKPAEARAFLDELDREPPTEADPFIGVIAESWRGLVDLLETRGKGAAGARALERIRAARTKLASFEQWERIRAHDFYQATVLEDRGLLTHLYFGTPYPHHREEMMAFLKGPGALPASYGWEIGKGGTPVRIEAINGRNSLGPAYLKEGQLPQRLLGALSLDFYRPPRVAEIAEAVYPGEYFNPDTTPDKVHQAVRRLRSWFEEAGLPLGVEEGGGAFRLEAARRCVLVVLPERESLGVKEAVKVPVRLERFVAALGGRFGAREFSATQAAEAADVSARSASRFLKDAREAGLVEQVAGGRSTRFKVKR